VDTYCILTYFLYKCMQLFLLFYLLLQVELFNAETQKKEATEKLHMPAFLQKEVSRQNWNRCQIT